MRALSSSEQQKAKALSTQPQFQNLSTADLRKILPNYGYAPRQVSVILSVATEISGRLHLELAANGTVGMSFVPDAGNAKRLWAGDAGCSTACRP